MNTWSLVSGVEDIFLIGSRIEMRLRFHAGFPSEFQNAVAEVAQEIPVMRNEKHRSIEVLQRINEHLSGCEIEMVGGLVQHEKIGGIH